MNNKKRKFLILYLDTGAGHSTSAKVMMNAMKAQLANEGVTDVEFIFENGFRKNGYGRFFTEKYYFIALNYIKGLFPLTYDFGNRDSSMKSLIRLLILESETYLKQLIEKNQPTDIISFHFAISPLAERLIKKNKWNISLKTVVTDPFTVPAGWFFRKTLKYYVYSEVAKEFGIQCGVPEKNIQIIPYLINPKYVCPPLTQQEKLDLRKKYGFSSDKKILLVCGGGEGLRGTVRFVRKCIENKADFEIAVVVGRVKSKYDYLKYLAKENPSIKVHVYSFINYLDEIVKISDCVVVKAGPALIMENVLSRKPIIVQNYIHNQELGNMRFVVQKGIGYFVQKPNDVYKKVVQLFNDEEMLKKIQDNYDKFYIETSPKLAAEILLKD